MVTAAMAQLIKNIITIGDNNKVARTTFLYTQYPTIAHCTSVNEMMISCLNFKFSS
jgi:hypothetical protein